jgi:hypothetical protein
MALVRGLEGYPHFRNSTASTQYFEPIYGNKFLAKLEGLPPALAGRASEVELVFQNLIEVSGFSTEASVKTVTQTYKGATRSYISGGVDKTFTEIGLKFHMNLNAANQPYVYNFFRAWWDLLYNPLTGTQLEKKDYIAKKLILTFHNKLGNAWRRIVFNDVFPTGNLSSPLAKYETSGSQMWDPLDIKLVCDYFDDQTAA